MSKAIARNKATRKKALSCTPGDKELSPGCSQEFHLRGAVVQKISQEAADTIRQFNLLDHRKDPGMVDAAIRSSKIRQ